MRGLRRRRFLTLLVSLLLLMVVYPLLHDRLETQLFLDVLFTGVFVAAFLVIFKERPLRVVALLLGVPTVVGLWTGFFLPGLPRLPLAVGFHLTAALFFVFTTATILREISTAETVTLDDIFGAFCGYVLIGLAFSQVYQLIDATTPGAFLGLPDPSTTGEDGGRRFLLGYFSFVTLTTVGYGDITPAGGAARGLAVVEAMVGQFYLAVLLAVLVGKYLAHAPPRNAPPSPPPA